MHLTNEIKDYLLKTKTWFYYDHQDLIFSVKQKHKHAYNVFTSKWSLTELKLFSTEWTVFFTSQTLRINEQI